MRRQLLRIVVIGSIVLATGCNYSGAGRSTLPEPRPFPTSHPPDGSIIARETESRWEKKLIVAFSKVEPFVNWPLLGLTIPF